MEDIIMSQFESITVEDVILRERKDGSGDFPVVVCFGVSLSVSSTGNQSITKRRVSLPLNDFTLAEGKEFFPKGSKLEGFRIEQYEVEPYEWTTPDGEVRTDNVRYRLVEASKKSEPATQSAPQSTTEPVPTEVGEDRPM